MDNYKGRVRNIRKLIAINEKNIKKLDKSNNNMSDFNEILVKLDGIDILIFIFGILSKNYEISTSALSVEYILGLSHFILFNKTVNNNMAKNNMNEDLKDYKKQIQDIHYLNLEKDRNSIINEYGENSTISIEKQLELLINYKNRILGVYDNNPPKEINKEIEYLSQKIKVKK